MICMTVQSPLRLIRKQVFNATQDELAQIGQVSRSRVSQYESGKEDPPYRFLSRLLADARRRGLKLPADWFFEVPANGPAKPRQSKQGKAA